MSVHTSDVGEAMGTHKRDRKCKKMVPKLGDRPFFFIFHRVIWRRWDNRLQSSEEHVYDENESKRDKLHRRTE